MPTTMVSLECPECGRDMVVAEADIADADILTCPFCEGALPTSEVDDDLEDAE